jgi:uncharacterized membrane protein YhaH (DUF805 family)
MEKSMSDEKNKEVKVAGWASWDDNWATGLALILVGGLFLLHTFGIISIALKNWWAVFILIPGLNMAIKGWRDYGRTNSKSARRTGFWGLVFILIAFSFLLGITWNFIFPAVLVGIGLFILLTK